MRKERFMDYGCNVREVRRIIKIRGFQSGNSNEVCLEAGTTTGN